MSTIHKLEQAKKECVAVLMSCPDCGVGLRPVDDAAIYAGCEVDVYCVVCGFTCRGISRLWRDDNYDVYAVLWREE